MKLKNFYFILITLSCFSVFGQSLKVTYENDRSRSIKDLIEEGDVITEQDYELAKSANEIFILTYKDGKSIYEPTDPDPTEIELKFSFETVIFDRDDYRNKRIFKDLGNNKMVSQLSFFFKNYLITGKMLSCDWTFIDSVKTINNYKCKLAVGYHPLHQSQAYAWFTDEIPVNDGPDNYWGLPGLILELKTGMDNIKATKIAFNPLGAEVYIPKDGKDIELAGYRDLKNNGSMGLRNRKN